MNLATVNLDRRYRAVLVFQPLRELVVNRCFYCARLEVIHMETRGLLLTSYVPVGDAGIVWIKLESNTDEIALELVVPKQGGHQHSVQCLKH